MCLGDNKRSVEATIMNRTRLILVGTGRMGAIRAQAMFSNPKIELCGVCDVNLSAAESLARTYSVSAMAKWNHAFSTYKCGILTRIFSPNYRRKHSAA